MPRGVGYQTDFIAKVLGRMGAADDVTISMVDRVARAHELPRSQTRTLIERVSTMEGGWRNPENVNRGLEKLNRRSSTETPLNTPQVRRTNTEQYDAAGNLRNPPATLESVRGDRRFSMPGSGIGTGDTPFMPPAVRGEAGLTVSGTGGAGGGGNMGPQLPAVIKSPQSNNTVQTQGQFGTAMTPMGNMGMLGAAGVGGLIGGTTSYATGGEFGQGFAVGAVGGFAGRGLKQAAMANMAGGGKGGLTFTKKFAGSSWATPRGTDSSALAVAGSALNRGAQSVQTMSSRAAFMGGAGLAGVMFGGDRTSHRRGFNQSRGSRF